MQTAAEERTSQVNHFLTPVHERFVKPPGPAEVRLAAPERAAQASILLVRHQKASPGELREHVSGKLGSCDQISIQETENPIVICSRCTAISCFGAAEVSAAFAP